MCPSRLWVLQLPLCRQLRECRNFGPCSSSCTCRIRWGLSSARRIATNCPRSGPWVLRRFRRQVAGSSLGSRCSCWIRWGSSSTRRIATNCPRSWSWVLRRLRRQVAGSSLGRPNSRCSCWLRWGSSSTRRIAANCSRSWLCGSLRSLGSPTHTRLGRPNSCCCRCWIRGGSSSARRIRSSRRLRRGHVATEDRGLGSLCSSRCHTSLERPDWPNCRSRR